jgi:monovalent cation/hydrogen antiporter
MAAAMSCPGAESAELVRHRYRLQLRRAEAELAADGDGSGGATRDGTTTSLISSDRRAAQDDDAAVVRAATEAQRHRLVALRADGTIGDAAFQRVEEELDWTELGWAQVVGAEQSPRDQA